LQVAVVVEEPTVAVVAVRVVLFTLLVNHLQ
jgi:hypothetical protein